ncbi:MAG: TetR/AcrR family transcriptional regulator [Peptococcaceae bacterium]|nr:TetR/AcrR family transcriptional regulator [Peptococcaceae bacterium]
MGEKLPGSECDTRKRLIKVALEEFAQSGYKGASTRSISERAGVNDVTLFRHFGSKLGLLKAAVLYAVEQLKVPNDVEFYLEFPMREGLSKIISDYAEQLSSLSELITLGMAESFSHPDVAEKIKKLMWEKRSTIVEYLERAAAQDRLQDIDIPVIAHVVLASLYYNSLIKRRAPQEITQHLTDERVSRALVEMILSVYSVDQVE